MARQTPEQDFSPIIDAFHDFARRCLIDDGSIFTDRRLWAPEIILEVKTAFVDRPDLSDKDFVTKLKGQLSDSSPDAQRLMAEMLWALLLFPFRGNMKEATKRSHIREIWAMTGDAVPDSPYLADPVLCGIGSAGPGFNNHRWRELRYLIVLAGRIKELERTERQRVLTDYDAFMRWIPTVPDEGRRQFRHMLRYLLFPERVEPMSSLGEWRKVLSAFGVAWDKTWTDRQYDDAIFAVREQLSQQYPGQKLDFYHSPVFELWQSEAAVPTVEPAAAAAASSIIRDVTLQPNVLAQNRIFYGPPGTGKTHQLRLELERYVDAPEEVDESVWRQSLVSEFGWRSAIAAALAAIGKPARVAEIAQHPIVEAKARQRGRAKHVANTIWATMQQHTPEEVKTVQLANRRPPFIFSKDESGVWSLFQSWKEEDPESAELAQKFARGPQHDRQPILRYRSVTFHPSFSYEDFIRGIRPVPTDDGSTQFQPVDGVFKQICDEARANPHRRYAIFIDEINRANIAKVFGELITLIEIDKRARYDESGRLVGGLAVQLPGGFSDDGSEEPFGVPDNLDIFGTMNTADRSIALLDVALRRRFEFVEIPPNYTVLESVDDIDMGLLLRRINDRLEFLLDRDHRIGHAYLMRVRSLDDLREVFRLQIIPLLQEYFFDDLGRVAMVLETSSGAAPMVRAQRLAHASLFSGAAGEGVPTDRLRYVVTPGTSWTGATFRGIYESAEADDEGLA